MHENTIKKINFEINQINTLLDSYQTLFSKVEESSPDLVELAAFASILHSFYNGIENIFQIIIKKIDLEIVDDAQWHKEILRKMSEPNKKRDSVISISTMLLLSRYLSFRHFYRHSYSFYLNWIELEPLVKSLNKIWKNTTSEIKVFLTTLESEE
ncbi:MAG: hypothetical protein PWQ84_1957 [Thermotogaceae bacterium]|nr:hypothetical protein [Thermotogaceae bacterium]